jgi:hypothetical protein
VLVDLDAHQRAAETGAEDATQQEVGRGREEQHQPVELVELFQVDQDRVAEVHGRLGIDVDAVGAAAELGVVEDEVQHLGEGQRHHDEIDAARAQHQQAGDQREGDADSDRRGQGPPQAGRLVFRPDQRQA